MAEFSFLSEIFLLKPRKLKLVIMAWGVTFLTLLKCLANQNT